MISLLIAGALAGANMTPAAAVAAQDRATATSSIEELGRAFQPSAIVYCIEAGAITATYQAQWKSALAKRNGTGPVSSTIEWVDAGATTAVARLRSVRAGQAYVDYVLFAKLADSWRIVGKVCQARDGAKATAEEEVAKVVDLKLAADGAWDDKLLGESLDARALTMTVEQGELVAATTAEWQARYRDRKTTSNGSVFSVTSRFIDVHGDIGVARWSFRTASGDWTDRALMVRTPSGWRMFALLYANEPPGKRD